MDSALSAPASDTALTNLFTGRPARGINNRIMRFLLAVVFMLALASAALVVGAACG